MSLNSNMDKLNEKNNNKKEDNINNTTEKE